MTDPKKPDASPSKTALVIGGRLGGTGRDQRRGPTHGRAVTRFRRHGVGLTNFGSTNIHHEGENP